MRDFSWTYFTLTGDVEAFMLYRETDRLRRDDGAAEDRGASEDDEPELCCTE